MIGQSFSPTQDPTQQRPQGTPDNGLQQAIQVLQLRMPHFFGGNAPAPSPLLNGPSAPMGFNLQALMQHLFGLGGGQQGPVSTPAMPPGPSAMPGPGAPPPMPQAPPPMKAPTPQVHYQPMPGGTAHAPFSPKLPQSPMNFRTPQ